jgi:xanthine dehydrogenase accessory factor
MAMQPIYAALKKALDENQLVAIATILHGPYTGRKLLLRADGIRLGTLGVPEFDAIALPVIAQILEGQQSRRLLFTAPEGEIDLFVDVYPPPQRLIIIGAVHTAIHLVTFARTLGLETFLLDARSAFATPERFPHVDHLLLAWPADSLVQIPLSETSYVVFLTHDEKIDNPALVRVLQSSARYIGALGSRKTHTRRLLQLRKLGVPDSQLARIKAPIGLDIGAEGPEEIALSIMAEIVAVRRGSHQILHSKE